MATQDRSTELIFSVYRSSISDPLTYIRIFTHVFGHFGFEHFIRNAMFLLLLGPMLEEKYGSKMILKIILITAMVTGIIHLLLSGRTMLCGASGVVFACIVLSSFTAFNDGEIPLSFILVAFLYIGKELYNSIVVEDNISNFTHILGGVIGSISGYTLNVKK